MSVDRSRSGGVPPLVAHVVHRFDYGGMENGIVNLINTMDASSFRHAVIALTEATDFKSRITRSAVEVYSLGKRPGKDFAAYVRLWRLLRRLRPAVLHTRNVGTMDCVLVGRLAGVRAAVHGEHGWDTHDPNGDVAKFRRIRRVLNPLVRGFITVSRDLNSWLVDTVRIPAHKVETIGNGVDTDRFFPRTPDLDDPLPSRLTEKNAVIIGSVLRFEPIKDPLNLVRAFIDAHRGLADDGIGICLVMIGDGALHDAAKSLLDDAGLTDRCWLPGVQDDIAEIMRCFDVFVLPSKREGISNTILEAFATGLPVIATRTGGNSELVDPAVGLLVAPENSGELAEAIGKLVSAADRRRELGRAARIRAKESYSLSVMADRYQANYLAALDNSGKQ